MIVKQLEELFAALKTVIKSGKNQKPSDTKLN